MSSRPALLILLLVAITGWECWTQDVPVTDPARADFLSASDPRLNQAEARKELHAPQE